MKATSGQQSHAHLHAQMVRIGAAGCLVVAGGGFVARWYLGLGATYPLKAALLFALAGMWARRWVVDHPYASLGPANEVTFVRAMLVAFAGGVVGESKTSDIAIFAITLAIVVAILDGMDGWLARRTGMASAFGARIDMETDALLIMVLAILVWQYGKAGSWVLAIGLMRYAFAAAGRVLPWIGGPLSPTFRGKAVAVAQVMGLCMTLSPFVAPPVSTAMAALMLAGLAWSFGIDVGRLWRQRTGEA